MSLSEADHHGVACRVDLDDLPECPDGPVHVFGSTDPAAAADIPNKWSYASTQYNPYLDRYLSLAEQSFVDPNRFYLQTAPQPTGPWTPIDPADPLINAANCPGITAYATSLHDALNMEGNRVLALTYVRPGPDWGRDPTCPFQERLVTVRLG